ncbi:MAG: hypothetical protein HDT16_13680 [Oscillibacter sp.]|nr:hypothetical protein [Oscillibacter sp.]
MRRFAVALILPLVLVLAGCGMKQSANSSDTAVSAKLAYSSDISHEDCYLCGGGIESLIPSYWGQNNIALISLNTFEIRPIEINRYDRLTGQLIEEYAGVVSFGGGGSTDGGFSANLMLEYDRGYSDGSVDFLDDETLDIDKAASFLCADCLNEIVPKEIDRCFGVGAIHLDTKEIRLFENTLGGFGLGDFHIDCDLKEQKNGDSSRMDLLIFYCPLRYPEQP